LLRLPKARAIHSAEFPAIVAESTQLVGTSQAHSLLSARYRDAMRPLNR
jgi:hypothetical protein